MASTTSTRIPLGVVFVILLLSSPRRRQRLHAVHGPSSGVALARSLAAAVVQRQHGSLRSCVRESTSSTTPAWSLGSCVRRRRRHASFHPTLI